jgi:hypothetical protein
MKNLRLWIFFCAIGEFLGIGFAAAVAVAWNVFSGDQSSMPWLLSGLIVMMFAGWVEGMCLRISRDWTSGSGDAIPFSLQLAVGF